MDHTLWDTVGRCGPGDGSSTWGSSRPDLTRLDQKGQTQSNQIISIHHWIQFSVNLNFACRQNYHLPVRPRLVSRPVLRSLHRHVNFLISPLSLANQALTLPQPPDRVVLTMVVTVKVTVNESSPWW